MKPLPVPLTARWLLVLVGVMVLPWVVLAEDDASLDQHLIQAANLTAPQRNATCA